MKPLALTMNRMFTSAEMAAALGCSRETVRRGIRDKRIPRPHAWCRSGALQKTFLWTRTQVDEAKATFTSKRVEKKP